MKISIKLLLTWRLSASENISDFFIRCFCWCLELAFFFVFLLHFDLRKYLLISDVNRLFKAYSAAYVTHGVPNRNPTDEDNSYENTKDVGKVNTDGVGIDDKNTRLIA